MSNAREWHSAVSKTDTVPALMELVMLRGIQTREQLIATQGGKSSDRAIQDNTGA